MNLKSLFIITLFVCTSIPLSAQRIKVESKAVTKDQRSVLAQLDEILKVYPQVDSMIIEFKENKPILLAVFCPDAVGAVTYYDLDFLGDRYLLEQKYSNLYNVLQNVKTKPFVDIQDDNQHDRIRFYVNKDGVSYKYSTAGFNNYANFSTWYLGESLMKSYRKGFDIPLGDSVLIIQCIVNQDRTLGDIGLIAGIHSSFYDFVLRRLRHTGDLWYPMTNSSGRYIRGLVDIYVKLDQHDNIEVSLTGKSRTLQIKDNDRSSPIFF